LPKGQTQATAQTIAIPVEEEVKLLRGFRDLVGERFGYFMGRRLTQQDMTEKTAAERKAVSEIRKEIRDNIPAWIKNADVKTYTVKQDALKTAAEALTKVSKPFREKIAPLSKAQKYLDNVAIPDALKELGTPVQPRFSLSKWIGDALASQKKKKKE